MHKILRVLRDLWIGLFRYIPSAIGVVLRRIVCKPFFQKCGKSLILQESVKIKWPEKLSIGDNTSINEFCWIEASGNIEIGNNVWLAPNVMLISFSHIHSFEEHNKKNTKANKKKYGKIVIEDNVWIGANCVVLEGVRIGTGSIIGAGSVVTKDVPAFTVYAGTPARKIRDINQDEFFEDGEQGLNE